MISSKGVLKKINYKKSRNWTIRKHWCTMARVEGVRILSVIRVHKSANYTVMSNHHFKEKEMSLKAKGLLSLMLSLPDDWNYSINGLVKLSKDGKDSVMSALAELEKFGYLTREKKTNEKGQFSGVEYNIYEQPQRDNPVAEKEKADKSQL